MRTNKKGSEASNFPNTAKTNKHVTALKSAYVKTSINGNYEQ